jgi:hypothetical protein
MSYTFPEPLFERVRDHLERAAAILHKDEAARTIRGNIEEAADLALQFAYRRSFEPRSSRLPVSALPLSAANENSPE